MTWWSEHSAVPRLVLAKLAIRSRVRGTGSVGSQGPLPCFRLNGSLLATPPFPPSGPGEPGSPLLIGITKALRLPRSRANLVPYGFGLCQAPRAPPVFVYRRSAPGRASEEALSGPGTLGHCRRSVLGTSHPVGACGISKQGFLATHPMLLPCSKTPAEPTKPRLCVVLPTPPPAYPNRKASACT